MERRIRSTVKMDATRSIQEILRSLKTSIVGSEGGSH